MPTLLNPFPSLFGDKTNNEGTSNWFLGNHIFFCRLPTKNPGISTSNFPGMKTTENPELCKEMARTHYTTKSNSAPQGLKDILWEEAGSIYQPPLLTQLEVSQQDSKNNHSQLQKDASITVVHEHDVCVVCLEELHAGQEIRILGCQHFFHLRCIDDWLLSSSSHYRWKIGDQTCPVCKKPIETRSSQISFVEVDGKREKTESTIPSSSYLRAGEQLVSSSQKNSQIQSESGGPKSIFFRSGRVHSSKRQEMQKTGLAMLLMLASATDSEDIDRECGRD